MIIFIDESGVHKQTGHSTTAVVYVEVKDIDGLERKLVQILKDLNINVFHWADHGWKLKQKFFKAILPLDFTCIVAVFKNPYHPEKMIETVFQHVITEKRITALYMDGQKPKWYERKLKKVLRDKGISVQKLKTVRNEVSRPGIQLADALAGLTRYYYENSGQENVQQIVVALKRRKRLVGQFLFESEGK